MQLSVQGSSPTFDIGDLPFETVASSTFRLIWVTSSFETGTLCLRYLTFFEIRPAIRDGVLLFEISNFLFKSRLFIQDGNCLFEIGNFCSSWKIVVIYNYPPIPTILYVPMTHILTVVEPHTTTDHSYSLTQNESKAATRELKYLTINL